MKMYRLRRHQTTTNFITLSTIFFIVSLLISTASLAQNFTIENNRILAPEVNHFTRPNEPGVDAHGDLSLPISLMTIPGRDGLNFDIVAQYRSGIQVTQSASWIGLGWNLDVGSVTRHALGGIINDQQADFTGNLPGDGYVITSQPDIYSVNMNGSSALLVPYTLESTLSLPFDPPKSNETGPCLLSGPLTPLIILLLLPGSHGNIVMVSAPTQTNRLASMANKPR